MDKTWVREVSEDGEGGLPMVEAIGKVRDEITGVAMIRHNGHSRELAMVMTKLDEARLWAIEYGQVSGTRVVVNRQSILKGLAAGTDTTDTTPAEEATSV